MPGRHITTFADGFTSVSSRPRPPHLPLPTPTRARVCLILSERSHPTLKNGGYQFSESASVVSHNPSSADIDSASAYQSYGQDEVDTGGLTTGFDALR